MTASARERSLRVLHLEDSEVDHELALAHLRQGGRLVQTLRVDSESGFRAALDEDWDAILSDYNMPGFSGLEALEILKASGRLLPFIIVSGEIGEETAVQAMRNGAGDYLLKSNLARLSPALDLAIEANETRRARVAADRELAASRQQLSALAQHLQTSVERERAAIAREIHDDVGGALAALNFDLAWIARHSDTPAMQQKVQSAIEMTALAIEATQRLMRNLRPAILEQGLVTALQWMAQGFEKRTGIECVFRSSHEDLELPTGVPLVAYRVVQEALTNVTKHAQASKVVIDVSLARGMLSIEVADNGRGMSADDLAKAGSFGIRGLRERVDTFGGWADLSSDATGTTLIVSIPAGSGERDRSAGGTALGDAGPDLHRHAATVWADP
jgi:signal transduction histidine kinase